MNRKIKPTVYNILKNNPYARENDNYLIMRVCQELDPVLAGSQFINIVSSKISMESITRARRKFLQENPDLKPKKISEIRKEEEQEYFVEYGG